MNNDNQAIVQALMNAQATPPPSQTPYALDPALEQQVAASRPPIHPLVAALMNHLGYFGMLRNRGNQQMVDPEGALTQPEALPQ